LLGAKAAVFKVFVRFFVNLRRLIPDMKHRSGRR
jgi:hypothetical protein